MDLCADVPEIRGSPWPHHQSVDLQIGGLHLLVDFLPQVLPERGNLTVRDNQEISVAPLLPIQTKNQRGREEREEREGERWCQWMVERMMEREGGGRPQLPAGSCRLT